MAAAETLADRLRAGEKLVSAWSNIGEPVIAEMLGRAGFDAVTLDMQHGFHSTGSVQRGIGAIALSGRPAIVRVPVGDFAMASRALDMGASAVIAPMVNSLEDAKALAAATKFPPVGQRSWGPSRAIEISGADESGGAYLQFANRQTLSFAMIETREALALLDDILAVDGIDGAFVGPADFSIAWSDGATVDPTLEDMMGAIESIAAGAAKAGKLSAVYAADPSFGRRYHEMGFNLVATAPDTGCLAAGAATFLALAKR